MIKRKTFTEVVFIFTLIVSVFSQVSFLETVARPLMYILWLFTFVICMISKRGKLVLSKGTKVYITLFALYVLFCLICGFLVSTSFSPRYLKVLIVPLIILLFVDNCPQEIVYDYESIAKIYVITAFVFALIIQNQYISSYRVWLTAHSYVYDQKNSAAQIWFCAVLLCWFIINPHTKKERAFWYGISAYLIIMAGLSQCRTAILAFVISLFTLIAFRSKHKVRWAFLLGGVLLFVFVNPTTREYIDQALLLDRYAGTDLDQFSSGRITTYEEAIRVFLSSPIIGVGSWYVDCSYLLILAESGIIGFLLIESIWISKLFENLKYRFLTVGRRQKKNFVVILTSFYIVESILEGFPPFGPGVCALGFWLFVGLLMRCDTISYQVSTEENSLSLTTSTDSDYTM